MTRDRDTHGKIATYRSMTPMMKTVNWKSDQSKQMKCLCKGSKSSNHWYKQLLRKKNTNFRWLSNLTNWKSWPTRHQSKYSKSSYSSKTFKKQIPPLRQLNLNNKPREYFILFLILTPMTWHQIRIFKRDWMNRPMMICTKRACHLVSLEAQATYLIQPCLSCTRMVTGHSLLATWSSLSGGMTRLMRLTKLMSKLLSRMGNLILSMVVGCQWMKHWHNMIACLIVSKWVNSSFGRSLSTNQESLGNLITMVFLKVMQDLPRTLVLICLFSRV